MPKFGLTVEGEFNAATGLRNPNKLELKGLVWNGDGPPDVIVLPIGTVLIKIGKYLSPGDEYSYRVATVAGFIDGELVKVATSALKVS